MYPKGILQINKINSCLGRNSGAGEASQLNAEAQALCPVGPRLNPHISSHKRLNWQATKRPLPVALRSHPLRRPSGTERQPSYFTAILWKSLLLSLFLCSNVRDVTCPQVELTKAGLKASLLVKAPETGEIFVNFDPEILALMRETECLSRMELDIPPFAVALQQKRDAYKEAFNKLQVFFHHLSNPIGSVAKPNPLSEFLSHFLLNAG